MNKKKKEVDCPVCKGTGVLDEPYLKMTDSRRKHEMVLCLEENGFSYREITKYMGYKSINSVSLIIKKKHGPKK